MPKVIKRTVLLTGAGFTQSFVGFLSSQMWQTIFNQPRIRNSQKLREILLQTTNYEDAYDQIVSQYEASDRDAFIEAIIEACRQMDEEIWSNKHRAPHACSQFLHRFKGSGTSEKGFIFTLNHDLFAERFLTFSFGEASERFFGLPGFNNDLWRDNLGHPLPQNYKVPLPGRAALDSLVGNFWNERIQLAYIKLHGSIGWFSENAVLVIGRLKSPVIDREPLLRWYRSIFKEVLEHGNLNLLVIGYSFQDPNINTIIFDGIGKGLKLYVVLPMLPEQFCIHLSNIYLRHLNSPNKGKDYVAPTRMWDSLWGYFEGKADDFFAEDNRGLSPKAEAFLRDLELGN